MNWLVLPTFTNQSWQQYYESIIDSQEDFECVRAFDRIKSAAMAHFFSTSRAKNSSTTIVCNGLQPKRVLTESITCTLEQPIVSFRTCNSAKKGETITTMWQPLAQYNQTTNIINTSSPSGGDFGSEGMIQKPTIPRDFLNLKECAKQHG